MKKTIFAVMAMALVTLAAGCSKEDPQQKELSLTVSEVTDNTAILNCTFTPKTAASYYQVRIGEVVSEEYSKDMKLAIANLASGKKHTVVASIFDANHKQVGTTEVEFRTTGTPDNNLAKPVLDLEPTISFDITDISDESVAVSCKVVYDWWYCSCESYSLSCDNGGVFSETGRFTISADKTLTLSNLKSGTEYTITATFYTAYGPMWNKSSTFTKK